MPAIKTYTAPVQEIRPNQTGAAALEQAARRINPLYQEIAANERKQGEIDVQKNKMLLWPMDIAKLYEARDKAGSGGIRFTVKGLQDNFGGPTETFADNPTQDTDPKYLPGYNSHAQMSRGAGALGQSLADGGYSLDSGLNPETGVVGDALTPRDISKPMGADPSDPGHAAYMQQQAAQEKAASQQAMEFNKARAAMVAMNGDIGAAAEKSAQPLGDYWRSYYGNQMDPFGGNTAGSLAASAAIPSASATIDNLSSYIDALPNDQPALPGNTGGL